MSNTYAIVGPTLESIELADRHFRADAESDAVSILNRYSESKSGDQFDLYELDPNNGYWSWVQSTVSNECFKVETV